MGVVIETFALTKKYKHQKSFKDFFSKNYPAAKVAIDNVTLKINEGEIFGLLGPNGSGKTTFLKMLSTILLPTSGTAFVLGHNILEADNKVRQLVGLVTGEERSFYWRLTGRQNLLFFATLYNLRNHEMEHQVEKLLEVFDLTEVGDLRVSEYSTGMIQKLAIARGLLNKPEILFLDEPTRGLDPIASQSLLSMIKERIIDYFGNTIILTTHILNEVEELCDRIAILKQGRIAFYGGVNQLKSASRTYDKYYLQVKHFHEENVQKINQIDGVIKFSRESNLDGIIEMELKLERNSLALSRVLKYVVQNRAEIISLNADDPSFEEMFRALISGSEDRSSLQT